MPLQAATQTSPQTALHAQQQPAGSAHAVRASLGRAPSAAPAIRVFAIDHQPLCRRGLAAMLTGEGFCRWAGEAGNHADALRLAPVLQPDVLLIEHRMPDVDGVATLLALRPLCPRARFLLLTRHLDATELRRAMDAGASGVLHQSVTATDLALAVRAVHSGQRVVPPAVAAALDESGRAALSRNELTPRELALLELMAQGLDNRAIAGLLCITVPTVKFHITNIMSKLHAANRTAAVLVALRLRLVSLNPKAVPA